MGFNKIIQDLVPLQFAGDTTPFGEANFLLCSPPHREQVTRSALLQAGYYHHKSFRVCFFHLH